MAYSGFGTPTNGYQSRLQQEIEKVEIPPTSPFVAPATDIGRIERITQQMASPFVSKYRRRLADALAMAQQSENPMERSMLTRASLEGYGSGIDEALSRSRAGAMSAYLPEYQAQVEAGRLSWAENAMRERLKYTKSLEAVDESRLSSLGGVSSTAPKHQTRYLRNVPWLWEASNMGGTGSNLPRGMNRVQGPPSDAGSGQSSLSVLFPEIYGATSR